jgi:predicted PurR-regulated permease PerM
MITQAYLKALSVMVFIIVLVFFLIVGKSLLVPLFMAGFFAILFTPFSMFLERYKVPRTLSCVISLLLMIAIVAGLIGFIIGNVVSFTKDFNNVSERLVAVGEGIDNWTSNNLGFSENFAEKAESEYFIGLLNENSSSISAFALNAIGSLSGLILIPVFMFFFLLYRDHLSQMMVMIYRDKDPVLVKTRITNLRKVIQNYITIKILNYLSVIQNAVRYLISLDYCRKCRSYEVKIYQYHKLLKCVICTTKILVPTMMLEIYKT